MDDIVVIYADDALLVLDKPSGMLSVPGRGDGKQDSLSTRATKHYPDACIVHRLDMATSGLLVMARGAPAQRHLNHDFANRLVHKSYEAVVQGLPCIQTPENTSSWHDINLPIYLDWPNRPMRIIDVSRGKPSCTRWRVISIDTTTQTSRLALMPVTGRSHQLRVHLLAINHPILGDALYAPDTVAAKSERLLLHATHLELIHPVSMQIMRFESPAPF